MSTLSKLKKARQTEKECRELRSKVEELEGKVSYLRLDILNRASTFVTEQQIIFGLVDHIFSEDYSRTKKEAQARWEEFKVAIEETNGDRQKLFDRLDVEVMVTPEENGKVVLDLWEQDRKKAATG